MANTIDRLKAQLLASGIQQKNQALFQVINQLIDALSQSITTTSAQITSISGGSLTGLTGPQGIPGVDGFDGIDGETGPQGLRGEQGLIGPTGPSFGLMPLDVECENYEYPALGNVRHPLGGEITRVAFNAANFTGNNLMTWTLNSTDQVTYLYTIIEDMMYLVVVLISTTVGGTLDTTLQVAIPDGFVSIDNVQHSGWARDNGVSAPTRNIATPGATIIAIVKQDGTNWTASANNTIITFQLFFPVKSA